MVIMSNKVVMDILSIMRELAMNTLVAFRHKKVEENLEAMVVDN
jgi:hypothetical protein